jgi:lipopolysaccharide biosynthesis glycosyltransferase
MKFQAETLMRSIMYFSKQDVYFTIVVNGECSGPIKKPMKLSKSNIDNSFISKHAEVLSCPYHWLVPTPSRWFVEPKAETCVLIDADMIACKDISPLFDLDKKCIHGVTAFDSTSNIPISNSNWQPLGLSQSDWRSLGFFDNNDYKYYFNFGMLVVPSEYMLTIGNMMMDVLLVVLCKFKKYEYFAAQISLAYVLKNSGINKNVLPQEFNWYDLLPEKNLDNILFLHYMNNKKFFVDLKSSLNLESNFKGLLDLKISLESQHDNYTKKIINLIGMIFNQI